MTTPRFEFDPEKDRSNRERHGIGFGAAEELWRVRHVVAAAKSIGGEIRRAIIGKMAGNVWVALFTMRGEVVRLISCHRADKSWERKYEKAIEAEEHG